MAIRTNDTGLVIPERKPVAASQFDFRPRKVETWLANLPLANIGETAREVYYALTESNRTDLAFGQRQKFLELIEGSAEYVSQALRKHYLGQAFPLSDKNQKIVALAKTLQQELALGYKILSLPELTPGQKPLGKEALAACLQRALGHLERVLLKCYQTYTPCPNQIWHEIHELYERGERADALHIKVGRVAGQPSSVAATYLKVLLLSLADPFSLRQHTLDVIHRSLASWAELCQLKTLAEMTPHPHSLSCNLDSDQPPGFFELHRARCGQGCRLLDTSQLLHALHHMMVGADSDQMGQLPVPIVRHLIVAWSGHSKRSFSRIRKPGHMSVTVGLSATHDRLEQSSIQHHPTEHAPPNSGRATFTGRHIPSLSQDDAPDIWDLTPLYSLQEEPPEEPSLQVQLGTETFEYRVVNESAGGLCLTWNLSDPHPNIQVGELLGLTEDTGSPVDQVGIGAVRWMKTTSASALVFGVELLAPAATPLQSRLHNQDGRLMRALLLPELIAIHQPATLITPNLYQIGDIVELHHNDIKQVVILTKLIHNSGIFHQFTFERQETVPSPRLESSQQSSDVLDEVWTLI